MSVGYFFMERAMDWTASENGKWTYRLICLFSNSIWVAADDDGAWEIRRASSSTVRLTSSDAD